MSLSWDLKIHSSWQPIRVSSPNSQANSLTIPVSLRKRAQCALWERKNGKERKISKVSRRSATSTKRPNLCLPLPPPAEQSPLPQQSSDSPTNLEPGFEALLTAQFISQESASQSYSEQCA